MSMQVFEYLILKDEKRDKDDNLLELAEILVPAKTVLARDEKQAGIIAAKDVPDNQMEYIDRIQIVLRGF